MDQLVHRGAAHVAVDEDGPSFSLFGQHDGEVQRRDGLALAGLGRCDDVTELPVGALGQKVRSQRTVLLGHPPATIVMGDNQLREIGDLIGLKRRLDRCGGRGGHGPAGRRGMDLGTRHEFDVDQRRIIRVGGQALRDRRIAGAGFGGYLRLVFLHRFPNV